MTEQNNVDRKDLKIQALTERIGELTMAYEDRDAERRVTMTEQEHLIKQLQEQTQQLLAQISSGDTESDEE